MSDRTTVEVSAETWGELNSQKSPGESFDEVIRDLLPEREMPDVDVDISRREGELSVGDQGEQDDRWREVWPTFRCYSCSGSAHISVEPAHGGEGALVPCCSRCGVPLKNHQIAEHDPGELAE